MHTKHMRLPTNVLVLASSSGFSREAKAVAAAYGIELVQPSTMDDARADAIVNRIDQLTMKKVDMRSTKVKTMMGATEHQGEEVVRTEADNLVLFENGDEFGVMGEIANHLLRAADASAELEKATGEEEFFVVGVDPLTIDLGDNGGVQQLWMRKDHPIQHLVPIRAILIEGEAEVEIRDIPMTYQQLKGSSFAYGHTTFGEHRALLVLTDEGREDGPQLSLRIKD